MQRAIRLQEQILLDQDTEADPKKLSLLRYQATHERSYYKARREL